MAYNVITVEAKKHRVFLRQQRVDPVTKEPVNPGDRVVICARCGSAFLERSWLTIGARHCGQVRTLSTIEVGPDQPHFRKKAPGPEEHRSAAPHEAAPQGHTSQKPSPHAAPGAGPATPRSDARVRLREISIRLRPVIHLREI